MGFVPSGGSFLAYGIDREGEQMEIYKEFFAVRNAIKFRNEIQGLMRDNTGIVREERKLQDGLKRLLALKKKFYSKSNFVKNFRIDENSVRTLEVKSALVACEAILRSALMREESRGAHFRSDFPRRDDKKWKVNIISRRKKEKRSEEMVLSKRRVKEVKGPLKDLIRQDQDQPEYHLLE